jgi:hypothetical protein
MAVLFWIIVGLVLILTGAIVPVAIFGAWALVVVLTIVLVCMILGAIVRGTFAVLGEMIEFYVQLVPSVRWAKRESIPDHIMPAGKEADEADKGRLAEWISRPPSAAQLRMEKKWDEIRARSWQRAMKGERPQ